jgi:GMP synthase (glutamine-hydrolysing)
MKILLVNNAEKGIDEYCVPLEGILREKPVQFKRVEYKDVMNIDLSRYRGFILSGSPRGDDIVSHHLPYFRWINFIDKPVFGICAGHHIIGTLYGARLIRDSQGEVGDSSITILQKDPVFMGLEQEIVVAQAHHDAITLPDKFIHLASSEKCPVQVMKHQTRSVYSTQFHPETHNPRIIANFLDIVRRDRGTMVS